MMGNTTNYYDDETGSQALAGTDARTEKSPDPADREHEDGEVKAPMTEDALVALIEDELRNSIGYMDETSDFRRRAQYYWHGEAKEDLAPPEIEGRSQYVDRALFETIEWMMPTFMRVFTGNDCIVKFEADEPTEEQAVDDATAYVNHQIMRRNDGFTVLHDAIRSCLYQRMGIVRVYADKRWEERREVYRGLTYLQVMALENDPDVTIQEVIPTGAELGQGQPTLDSVLTTIMQLYQAHQQQAAQQGVPPMPQPVLGDMLFDVVGVENKMKIEYKCRAVMPENFYVDKFCTTIEEARFCAETNDVTLSDLRALGYPEDKIRQLSFEDNPQRWSEQYERRYYDASYDWPRGNTSNMDESQRIVTLVDAFVKVDVDGDGIAEYRHVITAGGYVFHNEIVDDHEFALFIPIRVPGKLIGICETDIVGPIQRVNTALIRQGLDNTYIANNKRHVVDETALVKGLDDWLDSTPGGTIRAKPGMKDQVFTEVTVQDISNQVLGMVQFFDQKRQAYTGVTDFNQGMSAEALSKTNVGSMGADSLMNSAMQRIEMIARTLAETGIKRMWRLMLKTVCQYQNRYDQIQVNGRWLQVDPRMWRDSYRMSISVGVGTLGKQQELSYLTQLGQVLQQAAGSTPGLVLPQNVYNMVSRIIQTMGYRDVSQFISQPPPPQPHGQGLTPDAQAVITAEQIRSQSMLEGKQMDNVTKVQLERERGMSQQAAQRERAEGQLAAAAITKLGAQVEEIQRLLQQLMPEPIDPGQLPGVGTVPGAAPVQAQNPQQSQQAPGATPQQPPRPGP